MNACWCARYRKNSSLVKNRFRLRLVESHLLKTFVALQHREEVLFVKECRQCLRNFFTFSFLCIPNFYLQKIRGRFLSNLMRTSETLYSILYTVVQKARCAVAHWWWYPIHETAEIAVLGASILVGFSFHFGRNDLYISQSESRISPIAWILIGWHK